MPDTCISRILSWLVKTCIPDDPRRSIAVPPRPEKDLRRHRPPSPPPAASIASLPDDILLECLSRVPTSSLPSLPLVCRRFSLLLDSPSFLRLRPVRPTLVAVSFYPSYIVSASLDPLSSWTLSSSAAGVEDGGACLASINRSIYLICRSGTLRFDTWTRTLTLKPPTLFPRKFFAAATVNGKIYVAGGSSRTSAVEEYDPESNTWREVASAPVRRVCCVGASAGGVFYIAGGLCVDVGGRLDAGRSVDAYHVAAGVWRQAAGLVPGEGCVVGACGLGAHVYVISSLAVELSFWRWDGGRRRRRAGEGWMRLEPPPVRMVGLVRFSCCAFGEDKVVAVVIRGGRDDVGLVLVYDVVGAVWGRWPDLPPELRRPECVCVEC